MNSILCILFNVSVYCIVLHIMYNSDVFVVWWVHGASLVCVYRVGAWGVAPPEFHLYMYK